MSNYQNVRTVIASLPENLQEVSNSRKTAVVNNIGRLKMDIVTLQDTSLSSSGCIRESDFTFWQTA